MALADLERVTRTFPELVRIDSPTYKEQAIAERMMAELRDLGLVVETFAERGLPSVCLSAAMRRPRTRDEHVATADLQRLDDFLLGIVPAAAESEGR